MEHDALSCALRFHAVEALGRRDWCRLLQAFISLDACALAGPRAWRAAGLSAGAADDLERVLAAPLGAPAESTLQQLRRLDVQCLGIGDPAYPALLRTLVDPPPWLWLRGRAEVLCRPQLAVVGARKASALGLRAAAELATGLCAGGLVVTSGMALGIDGAAHRGALSAGGATVAVLGTGIDRLYPQRHVGLAAQIIEGGCVVSELPPGSGPRRAHFPKRNRLISGMTLGTLVVEAALPSGSLLTAQSALGQGREVFAVPWSIYHPGGRGCLQLLRDGAALVQQAEDVLANLGWYDPARAAGCVSTPQPPQSPSGVSALAERLWQCLSDAPQTADQLALHSRESIASVRSALGELELAAAVVQLPGGYVRS
jgi:DNA processing protein